MTRRRPPTDEPNRTEPTRPGRRLTRRSALATAGTAAGFLFGAGGLTALGVGRASAQEAVVDDFEHMDMSIYDFDRSSSAAGFVSDPTRNGSAALRITGAYCSMIRRETLEVAPEAGDTISYWLAASGDSGAVNRGYVNYGVQDHANYYFAFLDFDDDRLNLSRWERGGQYIMDDAASGFAFSPDQWYEVVVDWGSDGDHAVTVSEDGESEVASVSATDSTWTDGGIGFDTYLDDSETVYYDFVTLRD